MVSERWGEGTVQRYDGDQVTVLFDEHGYRELFVPVVLGTRPPAARAQCGIAATAEATWAVRPLRRHATTRQ